MKNQYLNLAIVLVSICLIGCVQKSYDRTIVFSLKANGIQRIENVGIRGNDRPLNWENDFPMYYDAKDDSYKANVTMNTGYLFTEFKFVVNGEFELQNQENRKLLFKAKDTIFYTAEFNNSAELK